MGLPPTEGENIEVNFKVAKKTLSELYDLKLWLGLNEAAKLPPSVEGPLPSTTKEASYYFCFACIFMIFSNKGKKNLFVLILSGYIPKVCLS